MALYSIRLDEASEQALIAAARSRKVTRAVILREAIAEYGKGAGRAVSPAQQFASVIGVIESKSGNLSERTGEAFARVVASAKRRRNTVTASAAKLARVRRKIR